MMEIFHGLFEMIKSNIGSKPAELNFKFILYLKVS